MEPDFSGYATKANLKCADGLTIMPDAFKHQDKVKVPLVWQHGHNDSDNVLGHAVLEAKDGDLYAYGYFNATPKGSHAKMMVEHGDIDSLSIWANNLAVKTKNVVHGVIRELSLVLSGANEGAKIDFVRVAHSEDPTDVSVLDDEAVIFTGENLTLAHSADTKPADVKEEVVEHAATDDETVKDVFDTLTDKQKQVVYYMLGQITSNGDSASHDALKEDASVQEVFDSLTDQQREAVDTIVHTAVEEKIAEHSALSTQEGNENMTNVFENGSGGDATATQTQTLSHAQIKTIVDDAPRLGSLKESFLAHADEYGITDIDLLFPDAKLDGNGVSLISRRMEWVQNVLSNTKHSPFSRIKSLTADITADEARARGYVKGNLKKDEVVKMLRRITTPKTIYKKQKLDRDDILDITDLDIVAWLKGEMRVMLDEELAGAILVSDGRDADDEDKIDEDHIRPIAYDIDMYTIKVNIDQTADLVDQVVTALDSYKGTGTPTLYTTQRKLTQMLLSKDTQNRRLYANKQELSAALLVSDIVPVEVMERDPDIIGVIVNLADYTVGADAGGAVAMFDDFDIDYNQQKYLIETRVSGALTKPQSAIVLKIESGKTVTPQTPTFTNSSGVVSIPNQTGVVYRNDDTGAILNPGNQPAISVGTTINIKAVPASGYAFNHPVDTEFSFTRTA